MGGRSYRSHSISAEDDFKQLGGFLLTMAWCLSDE